MTWKAVSADDCRAASRAWRTKQGMQSKDVFMIRPNVFFLVIQTKVEFRYSYMRASMRLLDVFNAGPHHLLFGAARP